VNRTTARARLTAFVAGLVFGVGLLVAGMTQPSKVQGFLDVAGDWDPSLAFVMVGAIAVHVFFARRALRPGARPPFAEAMDLPRRRDISAPLLVGAALFGMGWGIGGYCPGPAVACLGSCSVRAISFVAAMAVGTGIVRLLRRETLPLVASRG
jgi:uncharacterized protein